MRCFTTRRSVVAIDDDDTDDDDDDAYSTGAVREDVKYGASIGGGW